jgi:hypothetical protein
MSKDDGLMREGQGEMTGHSALPWRDDGKGHVVSDDPRPRPHKGKRPLIVCTMAIGYMDSDERDANTALIVRAVNSHAELLEAAEAILIPVANLLPAHPELQAAWAALADATARAQGD